MIFLIERTDHSMHPRYLIPVTHTSLELQRGYFENCMDAIREVRLLNMQVSRDYENYRDAERDAGRLPMFAERWNAQQGVSTWALIHLEPGKPGVHPAHSSSSSAAV